VTAPSWENYAQKPAAGFSAALIARKKTMRFSATGNGRIPTSTLHLIGCSNIKLASWRNNDGTPEESSNRYQVLAVY
jgi:hypothetical protein